MPEPVHASEGWPEVTAESFDAWRSRFLDGLARARELAHNRPASLKRLSDRPGDTQERVLNELGVHHAHHLGQIVLLRRLAGLWPPPGGGDTW